MTTTFLKTRRGELVNLAHVAQIEERNSHGNISAILLDARGEQLAAMPAPYDLPPGFVEVSGAAATYGTRYSETRHVYVNLDRVVRVVPNPEGHDLFDDRGRLIGRSVGAPDLEAGATIISSSKGE